MRILILVQVIPFTETVTDHSFMSKYALKRKLNFQIALISCVEEYIYLIYHLEFYLYKGISLVRCLGM